MEKEQGVEGCPLTEYIAHTETSICFLQTRLMYMKKTKDIRMARSPLPVVGSGEGEHSGPRRA